MKLKKISAAAGLLASVFMLVHIGYTVFAYLAFYYNPFLKVLTAVPFMVLTCVHAVCAMLSVFLQADGTRLNLYPKLNRRTVLQRVSAALILPLLILHINTYEMLRASAESGRWVRFALLLLSQVLFYAVVMTHIAVSASRGLITLGWLASPEKQKKIDRAVYILCAVAFVISAFVVLRTQILMFLPGEGAV